MKLAKKSAAGTAGKYLHHTKSQLINMESIRRGNSFAASNAVKNGTEENEKNNNPIYSSGLHRRSWNFDMGSKTDCFPFAKSSGGALPSHMAVSHSGYSYKIHGNMEVNKIYDTSKIELVGKLVYLSHPYNGESGNVIKARAKARVVAAAFPDSILINPLDNLSYMDYDADDYVKGLDACLKLLGKCKAIVLTGDWRKSKGCIAEYAFARGKGINVFEERNGNMKKL